MTTVLVTGVFDILHPGHLDLFKQARQHGDTLVAIVAHDLNAAQEKRKPLNDQSQRMAAIKHCGLVDTVLAGNKNDKLALVEDINPDIIVLGYDQDINEQKLRDDLNQRGLHPKIIRAHAYQPEKYKSSLLN